MAPAVMRLPKLLEVSPLRVSFKLSFSLIGLTESTMTLTQLLKNRRPITSAQREKGRQIITEIEQFKDKVVPHDNTALDTDRKKGTLEILAKPLPEFDGVVMAEMKVDTYDPEKPLHSLQVSISKSPESGDGKFVIDGTNTWYQSFLDRDQEGVPETTIFHKHDRGTNLMQSVYLDFKTGEMAYREETR